MPRPQSEAEYLARLVPPSAAATGFGRRALLRARSRSGAALPRPACWPPAAGSSGGGSDGRQQGASGTLTFGSNQSDAVPKKAYADIVAGFTRPQASRSRPTRSTTTRSRSTSTPTCRASPDDVFTWFAGYRMRSSPPRAWPATSATSGRTLNGFSDALKAASTGDDGKQYFVPFDNYPWAIFYRKSVFAGEGLPGRRRPSTSWWRSSKQMQKDGLVPIAFARQGRLARDGHVRPAQHAHQRLRLPRQT